MKLFSPIIESCPIVLLEFITQKFPILAFGPIETLCAINEPCPIFADLEINAVG